MGTDDIRCLLPHGSGLYAARVIPELDGAIIGFDEAHGGLVISGQQMPGAQAIDRNFAPPIMPQAA